MGTSAHSNQLLTADSLVRLGTGNSALCLAELMFNTELCQLLAVLTELVLSL